MAPGSTSALPKRSLRKLESRYVRPAVYHKFEQKVELSDGSTILRKSVYPRVEYRMLQDQRSSPIWNPSKPNLKTLLAADNSKLASFRKKFGELGEENNTDAFDLEEILSADAVQVTGGKVDKPKIKKKK